MTKSRKIVSKTLTPGVNKIAVRIYSYSCTKSDRNICYARNREFFFAWQNLPCLVVHNIDPRSQSCSGDEGSGDDDDDEGPVAPPSPPPRKPNNNQVSLLRSSVSAERFRRNIYPKIMVKFSAKSTDIRLFWEKWTHFFDLKALNPILEFHLN
jgi:hypothetical protein